MPHWCHPEAFERFRVALLDLERWEGLLAAAVALAAHDRPETASLAATREGLDAIVAPLLPCEGRSRTARLAHLHQRLFDELGFAGNRADYYAPENSYLPAVLETRRGIPISLSLVYGLLAARLGIEAQGVGAPGHFLVRARDDSGWILVDAFHGGRVLDAAQAHKQMEAALGFAIPQREDLLHVVSHRAWLDRMLRNLIQVFTGRARARDAAAMGELRGLLQTVPER